jgi:Ni/Fe-hydrogenase 1 B-type cytochrome subunit
VPSLVSMRYLREIHFLIMFAFLTFMIHHVYSAVLVGIEERSGLVGGMFGGYKFFPERIVKEDAQEK